MEYEVTEKKDADADNSNEGCTTKTEDMLQEHEDKVNEIEPVTPETVFMHEQGSSGLTTPDDKQQLNRRSTLRPRKCISKDIGSNLRKTMKKTIRNNKFLYNQHLETIFEEPLLTKQGELVFIGLSKAKRSITFSQFVTKAKLKKRKIKAKKLREKLKAERIKMEDVETKLWNLGL